MSRIESNWTLNIHELICLINTPKNHAMSGMTLKDAVYLLTT